MRARIRAVVQVRGYGFCNHSSWLVVFGDDLDKDGCAGTEAEKLHATFKLVDKNGDGFISMDEMVKFLSAIFRVVLSPGLTASMRSLGVEVDGALDLAAATALECFKVADLNADGRISFPEFRKWFEAPRRLPTFASIP